MMSLLSWSKYFQSSLMSPPYDCMRTASLNSMNVSFPFPSLSIPFFHARNMFRAWKNGMDNDGNGKLTFIEFSEAVRMQSYGGDIRELWKYFDQDNSDII